jgi:hypothetical protein
MNGTTTVTITGLGYTNNQVSLDRRCLVSLNWPVMMYVYALTLIVT